MNKLTQWILLITVLTCGHLSVPIGLPSAAAQGVLPEHAASSMQVAEGLTVRLTASEPLVRQPVCIEFDDRGRLWVIQYLQYPNPAELKRVAVDRYSRTQYDRIPEPPPHGPAGADRITILTDSDNDGVMDSAHDFVSGLNLATGLAFGHGGVFVLNVPYLLFYPDADGDDVPDSDPEVLLTGFGMEDAHSVANSLTWGPDGWLYGCQGSTVTANIRGIEFQQGVWRYHPLTREFELFCEGGGNSWGLDFDRTGRLFYSTNYGGHVLLHGLQGGSFVKAFAKHGALHNPFSYGYFDHATHSDFRGGHVTVGGIVYQADGLPDQFRDRYIGGDLLGHAVYWHQILPDGSTVRTMHGGTILQSTDTWFAPTDIVTGPDGAVYVADWHDARTAHPDPDAEWDRSNGRIFRIAAKDRDTPTVPVPNFSELSAAELLRLLDHSNQWYVRRARKYLAHHSAPEVVSVLAERALSDNDELRALEALWTLHQMIILDDAICSRLLLSPHAAVRLWTVRLMGDRRQVSSSLAEQLDHLAEQEPSIEVRQQLACTAARLPAPQAMPIINANINRDIDNADSRLPLLWWWAVERHSVSGRDEVLRRFLRPTLWKSDLGREFLLPRLVRRYMAEGTPGDLDAVLQLLQSIPETEDPDQLWPAVLQGLRDQATVGTESNQQSVLSRHHLSAVIFARWQAFPENLTLMHLCLTAGRREPLPIVLAEIRNSTSSASRRSELLQLIADHPDVSLKQPLLELLTESATEELPEAVQVATIQSLAAFDDADVSTALIEHSRNSRSAVVVTQCRRILLSRTASAAQLLREVTEGRLQAGEIPVEQIRLVALLQDGELDDIVLKYWGRVHGATREEKLAEVRRLNNDLRAGPGDFAAGREVFHKHCSACHKLFGEGKTLGPDLTTANRADREFLLISLVDPGSVIRKEYLSYVVQLTDGRVVAGMAVSRDDLGMTLVNEKNETTRIRAGEIAELKQADTSLMPENLYRQLTPQELRDLFTYLQSPVSDR